MLKGMLDDLPIIQSLNKSYSYSYHASVNCNSNNGQSNNRVRLEAGQCRTCRSFNSGTCTRESPHIYNGFTHDHVCSFCNTKGYSYSQTEVNCKKRMLGGGSVPNTTLISPGSSNSEFTLDFNFLEVEFNSLKLQIVIVVGIIMCQLVTVRQRWTVSKCAPTDPAEVRVAKPSRQAPQI